MKNGIRIALLIILLTGAFWLWRVLFPGDEVLIRRQLLELAETASFGPNEAPLIKLTNAAKVAGFFAMDAEIDLDIWNYGHIRITGRDEVRQAALGARNAVASLAVGTENIEITIESTTDTATVRFSLTGSTSRIEERQSQEMQLEFRKIDGDWLIHRARAFEYLAH